MTGTFARKAALAGLLALAVLLSACAGGAGAPAGASAEDIAAATLAASGGGGAPTTESFSTDDGVTLSGTLYGSGDTVALLAHMRPTDQTSWTQFAQRVAAEGYAAFTFDFRGYGESGGQKTPNLIDKDVRAAIGFLRGRGFTNNVLIGASMGGVACAKNTKEANVNGLALISSPRTFESLEITGDDLTGLNYAKLFAASEDDEPYVTEIRTMHSWAAAPKSIALYTGNAHGTDIFGTAHKTELEDALLQVIRTAAGDA